MAAAGALVHMGAASACEGLGLSRGTGYRGRCPRSALHTVRKPRSSPLALGEQGRQHVLD